MHFLKFTCAFSIFNSIFEKNKQKQNIPKQALTCKVSSAIFRFFIAVLIDKKSIMPFQEGA